jgi:protoporphyrinogen oxidase
MAKRAIIIGAGPAGLTAAWELLTKTGIQPVILEKSGDIGGISKTVNYKGNRLDLGGHRFFSKSDRVMDWWLHMMPVQYTPQNDINIGYQKRQRILLGKPFAKEQATNLAKAEKVMLVRKRLSRIYFLRKLFKYPIRLSFDTVRKLGVANTTGIMGSYLKARVFPIKPERSLEDFYINRFGASLYQLFFKDGALNVYVVYLSTKP